MHNGPMPATRKLVLASGSPRRRVLLRRAGFRFEVMRTEIVEEEQPGESPGAMVKRLAVAKAEAAAEALERGTLVLGADTTVVLDGKTLGKPVDAAEAVGILLRLAGREHRVITGFCLWDTGSGRLEAGAVETEIVFRSMSRGEAESYVSTGEPLDKAGCLCHPGVRQEVCKRDPWIVHRRDGTTDGSDRGTAGSTRGAPGESERIDREIWTRR